MRITVNAVGVDSQIEAECAETVVVGKRDEAEYDAEECDDRP